MDNTLLSIKDLESGYGDVQVLWGLDMDVRDGEITAVIGSNGAGKSTLLRTVYGDHAAASGGRILRAGQGSGVLLDEFRPEALIALVPALRQLAACRAGGASVVLEASGVQPDQLQAYAATGIDLISTSAPITRSSWLDLSMRFEG